MEPILRVVVVDIRRYNPSTLVWRKGKWYVQVTKPVELQYGSDKQSRRSTGTSDKHEARFLQHQLTQKIYEGFDKALERTDPVFEALRPILEGEGVNPKQWYSEGLVELTVRGDKTHAYKATGNARLKVDGTPVRFVEKWSASNHVELLGIVSGLGHTVPAAVIEYLTQEARQAQQDRARWSGGDRAQGRLPHHIPQHLTSSQRGFALRAQSGLSHL